MAQVAQRALEELRAQTGLAFELAGRSGHWVANPVALAPGQVAYLATDVTGRDRLAVEAARLTWAAAAGVPVPGVLALDEARRWLLVERVADDAEHGEGYVEAAYRASRALAAAGPPPPALGAARERSAGRADKPLRLLRGLRSPLSWREFAAVRAEAAALPATVTVHGDFHDGNVLSQAGRAVTVIDFEFLGRGPAGADLADLWVDLAEQAERDLLVGLAARDGGFDDLPLLLHWSAVRHLADLVTPVARRRQDAEQVALAVERLQEARGLRG